MSHDVIYFPSEKYFSDRIYVCPMDPSEPSESRFVHRSQIASIGHICIALDMWPRNRQFVPDRVAKIHAHPEIQWRYVLPTSDNLADIASRGESISSSESSPEAEAEVIEQYWVPRVRALVKKVRLECWRCKHFRARSVSSPVSGLLPNDRINPGAALVGIDFAGLVR